MAKPKILIQLDTDPQPSVFDAIVAVDAGSAQAVANLAFVLIDLSGIDMAIAEPERLLDQTRAGPPAQFPRAEPDRRNSCAVGFNELHRGFP